MIILRKNIYTTQHNQKLGDMKFERVKNFKYLGMEINTTENNHREIQKRMSTINKCIYNNLQIQINIIKDQINFL